MANEQNLIPMSKRTPRERREIARKGAMASNKVQAQRKTLKEELLLLLAEGNTQNKLSLALIEKAISGDTKAYEVIRDTIGEKQTEKIDANVNTDIKVTLTDD